MSAVLRLEVLGLTLRAGGRTGARMLFSGLQMQIGPGERWVVLGPNGAGKSSLLAALAGVFPVDAGEVRLQGRAVDQWRGDALADWRVTSLFSERERAALAFTDAMTRHIRVPDDVFADVRRHFDERQIVELSVLIGAYNMHTRVQEALKLDLEKAKA